MLWVFGFLKAFFKPNWGSKLSGPDIYAKSSATVLLVPVSYSLTNKIAYRYWKKKNGMDLEASLLLESCSFFFFSCVTGIYGESF